MGDPLGTATTALEGGLALERAAPAIPSIDLDLAQARAEAALFGEAVTVKVGRYALIDRAGAGGMGVVWSAWDPELGRAVALKLASSGDAAARGRARDEGRALARLSHPNVVPIYDVLEHGDRVFLVMELVKGETLRAAAKTQTAPQIVRSYRQAAEGLAAAHHAGLVHRDFKPDNAILGADGRVRVLDFGLAQAVAESDGSIAGTPRYMAPEQRDGRPLTAAVDQYALCVALREALTARGPVPRWVQPIVARGTAEAPADRFGSMDELARALARDPAQRWRRRVMAGVIVLGAGGVAAGFLLGRSAPREAPCRGGPALLEASWPAAARTQALDHLRGLDSPYAADSVPRLIDTLEGYRTGWLALHRASCLAHRRGEISAELLDHRATCLTRSRAALGAVGALAGRLTADDLPGLVLAASALPSVAACADDEALLARVQRPPPGTAIEVATIDELLARAEVERDAARLDEAAHDAAIAQARAEALGYRPLVARAALARGRVELTGERDDLGAGEFTTALRDALAVGDDALAVEAFARRAYAVATVVGADRATDGLEMIESIGERLGERGGAARALLDNNLGTVARARGDRAAARAAYERARFEAAKLGDSAAIELTAPLVNLLQLVDDPAARAALGAEVIATRTRLVGALHPLTLEARVFAAASLDDPEASRRALAPVIADLARYHPALGSDLAFAGSELLWLATFAGDTAGTLATADAIIAAADRGAPAQRVALARAYRALAAGDLAAARTGFAALLAAQPRGDWWERKFAADLLLGAAFTALAAGDRAAASAHLDEAARLYEGVADQLPPPMVAQRRAAIVALRAR